MDDLKRVGISFTSEGAVDFKKTLKEVNAAVKENYAEFKLAQSTWDKSTKTSEKLEARQRYLANQTSLYTQKVEQLTEELAQMEAAEKQDSLAIEKKRAQLNNAQAKLNEYDKSLKQVTDDLKYHTTEMKETSKKIGDFGEKTTDAGKKMSVVSGAVAGVGFAAVKTAADFETGMSKVAALSGATGSDLEKLEAKAREMGSTTKYSASESADALSYMALAGWDTNKMLAGIEPILNLAAASEMDLAEASDIVTDYMTAFGIECDDAGKNATHFSDMMAYAMSKSNTTTEMLGEAYKNVASTAASLGYTAEETTAVLMTMANAGVKGGESGTALSAIMTRLATNTKDCADTLHEYGVEVYDSQGNMNSLSSILEGCKNVWNTLTQEEQANLAKMIAGQNHYSSFTTIMAGLQEGAEGAGSSFTNYAKALQECDGVAADMAATMQDNLNGQLTTLKSQLEESAISIGQVLLPVVKDIVDKISDWTDKFNGLDDSTKRIIVVVALIVAAIGPLLIIVGKIATGISSIIGLVATLTPIIAGCSPVILAVIAVIGLLIAIGVNLYQNWDEIAGGFKQNWQEMKDTVGEAVEAVTGFIDALVNGFKSGIDAIKDWWTTGWGSIKSNFKENWTGIKQDLSNGVEHMKNGLGMVTGFVQNNWQGLRTALSNPFLGAFKLLYDNCGTFHNYMNGFIQGIKNLFNFVFNWPHIPMPHFVVSPHGWKVGDLLKGKIPSLSVDFYKDGALLNRPTIFGMNGNKAMVGGEAGAEAVLPVEKLKDFMRTVNSEQNEALTGLMTQAMYEGMKKALKELGISIVLDDEKVGELFATYLRKELFA